MMLPEQRGTVARRYTPNSVARAILINHPPEVPVAELPACERCTIAEVDSGERALDPLHQFKPHLMLLDAMLPGSDEEMKQTTSFERAAEGACV